MTDQYWIFIHFFLIFLTLIQLQWREDEKRVKQLAGAEDTNIKCFTIAFWNHLKYLNYLYAALSPHPSFCLCLLCHVLMFFAVYYPPSDWCRVYILSLEPTREAHAQSSFNICSNPCSSCRLNGFLLLIYIYIYIFPPLPRLLMLRFRRVLVSHTHLSFQCKFFYFSALKWRTK